MKVKESNLLRTFVVAVVLMSVMFVVADVTSDYLLLLLKEYYAQS
jgi:hypothetical protein